MYPYAMALSVAHKVEPPGVFKAFRYRANVATMAGIATHSLSYAPAHDRERYEGTTATNAAAYKPAPSDLHRITCRVRLYVATHVMEEQAAGR
jgi:hypothetical protein